MIPSSDHVFEMEAAVVAAAKGGTDETSVGAMPEYEGSREYTAIVAIPPGPRTIRMKKRLLHHRRPQQKKLQTAKYKVSERI